MSFVYWCAILVVDGLHVRHRTSFWPAHLVALPYNTSDLERSGAAQAGESAAVGLSAGEGGGVAGGRTYGADALPPTSKRSGFLSPKASAAAESTGGPYSSSAIAAATAAAIAAGPLALGSSASDASAGGGSGAPLPLLEVRGCTPIGPKSSRFEINLGQQLAHPSSLEWQVSLMWPAIQRVRRGSQSSSLLGGGDGTGGSRRMGGSAAGGTGRGGAAAAAAAVAKPPLKFRLYTLHTSDAKWLTLGGQREGQLSEGGSQVRKEEHPASRVEDLL